MFLSIVWDVSSNLLAFPENWPIIGGREIRWYGLLFAAGFVFGYFIMQKIFRREGIPDSVLDKLSTLMVIATIAGARLGHCLFYEPAYYLANPIEILYVWEGGLASHGAAIAIILSLLWFSKKQKKPYLWILDRIVIVVALAGFFIRMGNLMNSEIFGYPTELPWGFVFINASDLQMSRQPRHPTQIYEAISYLLIFIYLLRYYFKSKALRPGYLFGVFLTSVFSMRFLIEFLKEPQVGFESGWLLNLGQWLSIPFIISGVAFLVFSGKQAATPLDRKKT